MLSRRGLAWCLVLALVAGALSACLRPRAAGEPPPPVPEALWVADSAGTLRAFDGRTNRMSATLELGTPAPAATALVTGGGLIWAYQYDSGLAIVDPATARLVRRVPLAPA